MCCCRELAKLKVEAAARTQRMLANGGDRNKYEGVSLMPLEAAVYDFCPMAAATPPCCHMAVFSAPPLNQPNNRPMTRAAPQSDVFSPLDFDGMEGGNFNDDMAFMTAHSQKTGEAPAAGVFGGQEESCHHVGKHSLLSLLPSFIIVWRRQPSLPALSHPPLSASATRWWRWWGG